MEGADWLCQYSSGAVQGISQGPSLQEVLVTVQQEGVVSYDTVSKASALLVSYNEIAWSTPDMCSDRDPTCSQYCTVTSEAAAAALWCCIW